MALFPQFPYSNLHELNLDWLIEQIRQIEGEGVVLSVNGLTGVVTLYTDKDVVFPDLNFNDHWQIYREIDAKIAGLKFTGEKFFYITKNEGDEDFTLQEVYTSGNQPPYPVRSVNGQTGDVSITIPVTSVNERTGNIMLAGDNIPYNLDGTYTIEDVIIPLEKSIGHVIRYNTCAEGVSAGQYVYLILSGIPGRDDGLYKAVNAKSAGTVWTSADLAPVAGGLGALMAQNESAVSQLNSNLNGESFTFTLSSIGEQYFTIQQQACKKVGGLYLFAVTLQINNDATVPANEIAIGNVSRGPIINSSGVVTRNSDSIFKGTFNILRNSSVYLNLTTTETNDLLYLNLCTSA